MSAIATSQAPFIAVSSSYLSSALPTGNSSSDPSLFIPASVTSKLRNVGPSRVKDMRAAGVSMQIISHVPIASNAQACTKLNDALNSAICVTPDRFAAMALLPTGDPKEAARELQRCHTKYRFVGGVLGLAERLDGANFEELWTMAEKYRVPIALAEIWPTAEQTREYEGNYSNALVGPLVTNFHGSHTSSPLAILQVYASGVFDRHPNLRLILSDPGLTIASLLPRIESMLAPLPTTHKPTRNFLEVWQQNFYILTTDVLDLASMRALLEHIPMDRVLYAASYPFEEKGKALMMELKGSDIVGKEEWERIAWGNAESLFGLKGVAQRSRAGGSRSSY